MIDEWYTQAIHFKPNGTEQMPLPQENPITLTPFKQTTLTTKTPKSIHTPWTLTLSTLKNSPRKKGKNASRKANAFGAENLDITQEIALHSQVTTVTLTLTQKPHQGNLKNQGK